MDLSKLNEPAINAAIARRCGWDFHKGTDKASGNLLMIQSAVPDCWTDRDGNAHYDDIPRGWRRKINIMPHSCDLTPEQKAIKQAWIDGFKFAWVKSGNKGPMPNPEYYWFESETNTFNDYFQIGMPPQEPINIGPPPPNRKQQK